MNPDFIFLKREILLMIMQNFKEHLELSDIKAHEAWANNDSEGFFDVWEPICKKLRTAIREVEFAINNLHTEEGTEIYNKYMQGQNPFKTVFEVLDPDDAFMDERYGDE